MDLLAAANPFGDAPIWFLPETDSTMDDARRLWRERPDSGLTVVSEFQRRGRGRRTNRRWESPPGHSLMFTVALSRSTAGGSRSLDLPLRVGCAVATVLRIRGIDAKVKWPNDVLIYGRKVCGILVETVSGGYIVGVGLNCNQTRFSEPLRGSATSLRLETGRRFRPVDLLTPILDSIRRRLSRDLSSTLEPLLWGLGRDATVRLGESVIFGRIVGIEVDGALKLRTNSGVRRMVSGEIIVY
jgi:BirA family biotin operon repressor/biotin-[acetyl-CoA-carboxylase] ligase